MFPTSTQATVSNRFLAEVASSGMFPDPAVFVYGILGTLVITCLLMGYLTVGRSGRRASDLES
ncbi:MAG: hypothetical protein PVH21_10755 [Myxococcales bacterium]|jgi:hypothetical protein